MRLFTPRPGTQSVTFHLIHPFPNIAEFNAVIRLLVMTNPLGCTSYHSARRHHPPVEVVRQMYTAKFIYLGADGKRVGSGQDMYDSVEGYENGIAAVISNMANLAAHGGKVKHLREADLFSVLLKCHDNGGEMYFLSLARDRITLSSYTDESIRERVEKWTGSVPALG